MFDELRQLSDGEALFEEPESYDYEYEYEAEELGPPPRYFLGLTPGQRFVLSLMLLGTVTVIGLLGLMVLGKLAIF
jgi:hypothetical protein